MATTITHGASTITPILVLGYGADRAANNIVHAIPGRSNPDVTLRPANLRTGTLELGFTSELESKDAADLHATGGVFTLSDTDRASVGMSYVASGRISRALEDTTRGAWVISVDFQEVTDSFGAGLDGGTP